MMNLETCDSLNCYSMKTDVSCYPPPSSTKKRSRKHASGHRTTCANENQISSGVSSHVSSSGPLTYSSPYVAFPMPSNEEACGWTKPAQGVLSKREKNRLRRREERANPAYREKERAKARLRMQEKRKDPLYRELERLKNRIRMRSIRGSKCDSTNPSERSRKHACKTSNTNMLKEGTVNGGEQFNNQGYQQIFK